MAVFTNLHHVGEVMVQILEDNIVDPPTIQVGPPIEDGATQTEEIRITLLWVTPQPGHRGDKVELNAIGQRGPPPMTLSVFYLITTHGSTVTTQDPERAHELLGNVIQTFHSVPVVNLENLPDLPGDGRLTFIQPPMTAEMMEHIYTPLGFKHRSWVLFEVSPVQLAHLTQPSLPGAQVRPDGIRLQGPDPFSEPEILRLVPQQQAEEGIVRLDVDFKGRPFAGVYVAGVFVEFPSAGIAEVHPGATYLVALPEAAKAGKVVDVRVQTGELPSNPPKKFSTAQQVGVLAGQFPSLNAPGVKALTAVLVLNGRGLTGATHVFIWPDGPLADQNQVKEFAIDEDESDAVEVTTVEAPEDQGLTAGTYRSAVRFGTGSFTPYVLLELA
jgi:hypothetical protein